MTLTAEPNGSAAGAAPGTLAGGVARPPSGLYVHVPFCVSICPYCDFVVYAGRAARGPASQVDRFVAALEVELGLRADALDEHWGPPGPPSPPSPPSTTSRPAPTRVRPPLETLYLGGGTPSLLPAEAIARLIALVRRRFGLVEDAEVTLEANPGPDERGDARATRAAGVTRLSVGAQSFVPSELRGLGRRHGPDDVAATVRGARDAGIESVSLDLLYDVPGQTLATWEHSLEATLALEPDHLSLYALTLDDPDAEGITGTLGDHLPGRPGARAWRDRGKPGQDEDRGAAMYALADDRLAVAGFRWYEISNWTRPGHASRHNLGYWRGNAWEAAGPGAHAFDGATRRWNAARLDGYLAALLPPGGAPASLPPGASDERASHERPGGPGTEPAILALRTSDGLPRPALDDPQLGGPLRWAIESGLLLESEDRIVLTRRGRLLSNEVFVRLV